MSDKVRQLAPKVWEEIQKAKHILLSCHSGPDGDSYGSVLATVGFLENCGKKVTAISGDDKKLRPFSGMPGYDKILEKNFFEIEKSDFDLFLIEDCAALEQVSKIDHLVFPSSLRTVVIDHHPSNPAYGEINLIDTSYPATCQMLYDLFNEWGETISPEVALCLYVGMYTDTGGFKYPLTKAETLFVAADLAKINPDFPKTIFSIENSASPGELKYMSLVLNSIELYFSGNVAIASIRFEDLQKNGLKKEDIKAPEIANILKSVVGWNIGVTLSEKSLNQVDISLRTRDLERFDLSKLGLELGGGGLQAAAGATIKRPFEEVKQRVLASIQKVYPELGTP